MAHMLLPQPAGMVVSRTSHVRHARAAQSPGTCTSSYGLPCCHCEGNCAMFKTHASSGPAHGEHASYEFSGRWFSKSRKCTNVKTSTDGSSGVTDCGSANVCFVHLRDLKHFPPKFRERHGALAAQQWASDGCKRAHSEHGYT